MLFVKKDWKKIWKNHIKNYVKEIRNNTEIDLISRTAQIWTLLTEEFIFSYAESLESHFLAWKEAEKKFTNFDPVKLKGILKLIMLCNYVIYSKKDSRSNLFFDKYNLDKDGFKKCLLQAWGFNEEEFKMADEFEKSIDKNYERFVTQSAKTVLQMLGLEEQSNDGRFILVFTYYRYDHYERDFMQFMNRLLTE